MHGGTAAPSLQLRVRPAVAKPAGRTVTSQSICMHCIHCPRLFDSVQWWQGPALQRCDCIHGSAVRRHVEPVGHSRKRCRGQWHPHLWEWRLPPRKRSSEWVDTGPGKIVVVEIPPHLWLAHCDIASASLLNSGLQACLTPQFNPAASCTNWFQT